jgi:hypothetical protein
MARGRCGRTFWFCSGIMEFSGWAGLLSVGTGKAQVVGRSRGLHHSSHAAMSAGSNRRVRSMRNGPCRVFRVTWSHWARESPRGSGPHTGPEWRPGCRAADGGRRWRHRPGLARPAWRRTVRARGTDLRRDRVGGIPGRGSAARDRDREVCSASWNCTDRAVSFGHPVQAVGAAQGVRVARSSRTGGPGFDARPRRSGDVRSQHGAHGSRYCGWTSMAVVAVAVHRLDQRSELPSAIPGRGRWRAMRPADPRGAATSLWVGDDGLEHEGGGADLQPGGEGRHIGVAKDHMEPPPAAGSACGSSRVLMSGRRCMVSTLWSSVKKSLRWEIWKPGPISGPPPRGRTCRPRRRSGG